MPLQLTPFRYEHPNRTQENRQLFAEWLEENKIYVCFYEMSRSEYSHFDDRFYNLIEFNEELIFTHMPIHKTVNEAFSVADELNKRVIIMFAIGTTITGYDFFQTLDQYNGHSVVGHIVRKLWHKPETYYQLHPQTVIADLDDWRSHGRISFNECIEAGDLLYGIRPDENVVYNDDPDVHLPLSIEPDTSIEPKSSLRRFGFGSKIINKYIGSGLKLAAFNKTSRKEKKFLGADKRMIDDLIERHKRRVFAEPLDKMYNNYSFDTISGIDRPDFKTVNTLVSVALPINIIHKAIQFDNLTDFVVVDWSEQQLDFCRAVLTDWDGTTEHYNKIAHHALDRKINYNVPFEQSECIAALNKIRKSVKYSIENIFEFTVDRPALYSISNCIGYEPTALLFNREQRKNLISEMLKHREFILTTDCFIYC